LSSPIAALRQERKVAPRILLSAQSLSWMLALRGTLFATTRKNE